jgi:hypothetical protein
MLALAHHYDELVAYRAVTYRARVYGEVQPDGMWAGWLVFFPTRGGHVMATARETTQSSLAELSYWASGLTHSYLHGALERAMSLKPEAQLARELERLELIEASAETRAETLETAAAEARTEAHAAEVARERTEERFLGTIADTAETDARAHEVAAAHARDDARAAKAALRARRRTPSSKSKKKK